jgi:hypothetical protein
MATITLYKDKLNGVGGFINGILKNSNNLDTQLTTLKSTLQGVDSSTYNLEDAVESIRSSSKSEKDKVSDLKKLNKEISNFINTVTNRDNSARDEINKKKDDFYTKYNYLKPECEKDALEKIVDSLETVADWCAKHWKLIATIVIVAVAIVLLVTGVGGVILAGACWGAIMGAVIGGVSGGLESMANGGSFLQGFEDGAFSGAVSGAIMGGAFAGLGAAGAAAGKGMNALYKGAACASNLGKAVKGIAVVSKVISGGMGLFDTLALADMALDNGHNPIADLNKKLHSNKAYNIFQTGVSALAVFTGGMTSTMKCFIAGTKVITSNGLVTIERIKVGDMVLSTNADNMETEYKAVLETYVRKTKELVHLYFNGEEIMTTSDHPFYVVDKGFVNAIDLCIGSKLMNNDGEIVEIEQIYREILALETVKVYNLKVEDFHTYYVGENSILVHNADYNQAPKDIIGERSKDLDTREHPSKQKQIGAKEKKLLKSKVEDRTITKEEYKTLKWNEKMSKKRQNGVNKFWEQERTRVKNGENGTRNWSESQKLDIINGKRPKYNGKTIQGHHTYSVSKYPHLADKGEIIYPATQNEHFNGWHGGNYKNSLPGEPIKTILDF